MIPGLSQLGGPRRRNGRSSEESRSRSSHHHTHHHHHQHHQRPRVTRTQQHDINEIGPSSRPFDGDRLHRTRLLLQRHTETDAHRVALEARGRLDERLREASLHGGRRNLESSAGLAQQYLNALFVEQGMEDEMLPWEVDQEWEASLTDWLAGPGPSFREQWRPEWMNDAPISGLSKAAVNALPREVYRLTKPEGQVECSVCLEQFTVGQTLLCLPCKHKFHIACLTPWLESHEQCPYCRAQICAPVKGDLDGGDNLLSWLEAFETGMSRRRFNLSTGHR